jgi:methyltransferase-like protein
VELADLERAVLLLLDGTRDLAAVAEALVGLAVSGGFDLNLEDRTVRDPEIVRGEIAGRIGPAVRNLEASALLAG